MDRTVSKAVRQRQELQLATVVALRLRPGLSSVALADALQVSAQKATALCRELELNGLLERRWVRKTYREDANCNPRCVWYPAGAAPEAGLSAPAPRKRGESGRAAEFVPVPDFDAEHADWVARITGPKVRFNPWGRG